MKSIRDAILIPVIVVVSALSWYIIISTADALPKFPADEVPNVQSAVSFLTGGKYENDAYGLIYSSGPAVTWPGAVGWLAGRNMLGSRLGCAFFSWIFAVTLAFVFLRRKGYSHVGSLASAVCLWGFTITSPFAMPYWFGFMYNLGELNTIILIGIGLLLIGKNPFLSVFIFGVSVWHGKYVYLPFVLAIMSGDILSRKLGAREIMARASAYAAVFLAPLILWVVWIAVRFDMAVAQEWLMTQLGFLEKYGTKHGPQEPIALSVSALMERLRSPELEWANYSTGTKIKNLLFSFGAVGFTLISIIGVKTGRLKATPKEIWISLLASATIGFYSIWYFFVNQFMWQRYFHPAIYIGFGLFIVWGVKWERSFSKFSRPALYLAVILLLAAEVMTVLKRPLLQEQVTYARACTDLYGPQCEPPEAGY